MDALRGRVAERAEDQTKNNLVFEMAMCQLAAELTKGRDVVYDATNVTIRSRRIALRIAGLSGATVITVFFDTPYPICVARNARRHRRVPLSAMIRFSIDLVPPLPHEYDECCVVSHKS
jgi:predicted kinase